MKQRILFGADFASSGLKVAQVRLTGREALIEHLIKVKAGDDFAKTIAETGITPKGATVGLSATEVMIRYLRTQQVPAPRLKMIMDFELGEMKSKSTEPLSADYILNTSLDTTGECTSMVVLVKEKVAASRIADAERAHISAHSLLPNSLALYNVFLAFKKYDPKKTYLLLDIGAETSSLAVVEDLRLLAARSLPFGGKLFTQFLADSLGVSFHEAEEIKKSEGLIKRSGWTSEREKRISEAMKEALERFTGTVTSSLMFLKRQLRKKDLKFDKVLLFGGGATLNGLPEHLSSIMRVDVELVNIILSTEDTVETDKRPVLKERIPASELRSLSTTASDFATAVGLALSTAGKPFISLDLVPDRVKRRIIFRERTVYLLAAGVLLLVFAVLLGIGVHIERGSSIAKKDALAERYSEAQSGLVEMQRMRKEVISQRDALRHLLKLPDANRSIVSLLSALGRKDIIPDDVTLTSLTYRHSREVRRAEREVNRMPPSVRLSGEVVGEWGTEIDAVRSLRNAIASLEYVESVSIDAARTKIDRARGRYIFSIVVQFKER